MQNTVNISNATSRLPKHLILKLKKQDADHLIFSYLPEGIEKKDNISYAEGQISAELMDGKWHAKILHFADLDLVRSKPYATAAVRVIKKLLSQNSSIIRQQKIWFIM